MRSHVWQPPSLLAINRSRCKYLIRIYPELPSIRPSLAPSLGASSNKSSIISTMSSAGRPAAPRSRPRPPAPSQCRRSRGAGQGEADTAPYHYAHWSPARWLVANTLGLHRLYPELCQESASEPRNKGSLPFSCPYFSILHENSMFRVVGRDQRVVSRRARSGGRVYRLDILSHSFNA